MLSLPRHQAGSARRSSVERFSHSAHAAYPSRVLYASRPPSTKIRHAETNIVNARAASAVARVARWRIAVQATADGIASIGSIGTKNRAGALEPPHHIAKWVTTIR